MADAKTRALAGVALFAHCGPRDLEFVASRADEVDVAAGHELLRQGQPGDTFFVLLEGAAAVDVDGEPRRTLGPGDFFGEISMLDRGNATATVTTTKPSVMMVMSHSQFRDAVKASESILVKVLAVMGRRLRSDLEAMHEKDAKSRKS